MVLISSEGRIFHVDDLGKFDLRLWASEPDRLEMIGQSISDLSLRFHRIPKVVSLE